MKRACAPMLAFAALFAATMGCGDLVPAEGEEGTDGAGSDDYPYDAEPGTCDGWKVRYCEAYVQCGHGTLDQCIAGAEFVKCHAESAFADCERQFQKVINRDDCSLFPVDCYPRDVADPSEAASVCRAVQEAACEFDFYCGYAFSLEVCLNETTQLYRCDERLSVGLGGEACVTELNRAACGDPLPASCMDHTRF